MPNVWIGETPETPEPLLSTPLLHVVIKATLTAAFNDQHITNCKNH